jgi:hypothetical protein
MLMLGVRGSIEEDIVGWEGKEKEKGDEFPSNPSVDVRDDVIYDGERGTNFKLV